MHVKGRNLGGEKTYLDSSQESDCHDCKIVDSTGFAA